MREPVDSPSVSGVPRLIQRNTALFALCKSTDTYGRKPGILVGLVRALAGAVLVGLSMRSFDDTKVMNRRPLMPLCGEPNGWF